ncbi:hypothetical protein KBK19_03960 [Microvirga sp. STR05]|uniref:Uncharacterized protein n=1 Tax=Hymenobacter duratus TaxID=2771356 RepID=A0ABR8JBS0_9BACT|nr:hypothetical protein [Hymenobacter duratus]MBD2714186.1 hypothetical protein [Hymenobacter duratus]MBR7949088.1 hypothetical protein [Microvirga sp. STR05]
MECLFLSPAPHGRRVCLYAVPDGIPLYFKHTELTQQPEYQTRWRGNPALISEEEAQRWVARHPTNPALFLDYQQPDKGGPGLQTARASFLSAVAKLAAGLEYSPGSIPEEILIGEEPE